MEAVRWRFEERHYRALRDFCRFTNCSRKTKRICLETWHSPLPRNTYISPIWLSDRTRARTWNCACIKLAVRIEFLDNAEGLDRSGWQQPQFAGAQHGARISMRQVQWRLDRKARSAAGDAKMGEVCMPRNACGGNTGRVTFAAS
jgi:hypothetical protein